MSDEIRLLQFSDTHLSADPDGALRGVLTRPALRSVLSRARAPLGNATGVLLTGDLVNDDAGGYACIRELFTPLGKPVWCLPGNHDDVERMRNELAGAPFQVGGCHDVGAWRLVLLDSCVPGRAHGNLAAAELSRLEAALAGAAGRHVLIALHHHPVLMGSRWLDSVGLQNPEQLFAITDRHPQVRGVIWGHVHQNHDSRRKGVRLLAAPSTCAQFLPGADQFAIDPSPPGYRRLTLRTDGSIETEVIRVPQAQTGSVVQRAARS